MIDAGFTAERAVVGLGKTGMKILLTDSEMHHRQRRARNGKDAHQGLRRSIEVESARRGRVPASVLACKAFMTCMAWRLGDQGHGEGHGIHDKHSDSCHITHVLYSLDLRRFVVYQSPLPERPSCAFTEEPCETPCS